MTTEPGKKNVVDLAEARKRQKTVRVDAGGRRVKGASKAAPAGKTRKFVQYLQLLLVVGMIAYLMQLCSGGSP